MTPTYYCLWYRLDGIDGYLIWFSHDVDGVVTEADGSVPSFRDQQALYDYALAHQIPVDKTEPVLNDLDVIDQWLRHAFLTEIDCRAFLDAWNLFTDLSRSVNGNFDHQHKRTQHVYEKLFWGNNLPSVTPSGKHYTPRWRDQEVVLIGEVLSRGLQLFRAHVRFFDR